MNVSDEQKTAWEIGQILWGQDACPASVDEYQHQQALALTAAQRARLADALVHVPPAPRLGSLTHNLSSKTTLPAWRAWIGQKRSSVTLDKNLYIRLYRASLQDQSVRSMLLRHLLDPRPIAPCAQSINDIVGYLDKNQLGLDQQVIIPRHRR